MIQQKVVVIFFTFNNVTDRVVLPNTGTVNVTVDDTRAMVIDEPKIILNL